MMTTEVAADNHKNLDVGEEEYDDKIWIKLGYLRILDEDVAVALVLLSSASCTMTVREEQEQRWEQQVTDDYG